MDTSTLPVKGWKFCFCAQHSLPLSNEGCLACHTYCNTGHPFIIAISEDPWHLHLLPSIWQWSYHYLFIQLRSVAAGIRVVLSSWAIMTKQMLTDCNKSSARLLILIMNYSYPIPYVNFVIVFFKNVLLNYYKCFCETVWLHT